MEGRMERGGQRMNYIEVGSIKLPSALMLSTLPPYHRAHLPRSQMCSTVGPECLGVLATSQARRTGPSIRGPGPNGGHGGYMGLALSSGLKVGEWLDTASPRTDASPIGSNTQALWW